MPARLRPSRHHRSPRGISTRSEGAALPAEDASLLASFLRGLALYRAGKIEEASKEFRASVRASPDFLPGVFYLGACYAAGGNARQAVGAWQTALIGDDPLPEVYQLVADSYLRLGDGDEAANLLQEAGSRWPDDPRFAITSALARAANGHVTEALAGLKPVLDGPAPGKRDAGAGRPAGRSQHGHGGRSRRRRGHIARARRQAAGFRSRHAPAGRAVARVSGQTVGSRDRRGRGVLGVTGARGRQRRARRATRRESRPP